MLHLLNATIIPVDGTFKVYTVTEDKAHDLFWRSLSADGSVFSHIGHGDGTGTALVLQLKQRSPEGKILSVDEMVEAGYSLRVIEKVGE